MANGDSGFSRARADVAAARAAGVGIYDEADPLRLMPFELRFLARKAPPDRWLIDLGATGDELIPPHSYFRVERPEDRLFIPAEYVDLFESRGWRRGA
jgi:hypothetical protein